ncbi:hypothetical protein K200098A10_08700 [Flavonifractor plautii]
MPMAIWAWFRRLNEIFGTALAWVIRAGQTGYQFAAERLALEPGESGALV